MKQALRQFWQAIRRLSGDDAYEQYLQHFAQHHAGEGKARLSRQAFFKQWQDKKWSGVKRCC